MFGKLDVRHKSIVSLALSSNSRKIFCKSGPRTTLLSQMYASNRAWVLRMTWAGQLNGRGVTCCSGSQEAWVRILEGTTNNLETGFEH